MARALQHSTEMPNDSGRLIVAQFRTENRLALFLELLWLAVD
ncbi:MULTISPECIES: hypothetical protein [Rhizobium]|uniref:Uncharacterized protein n=1 Tax=Rhizobium tropici TaxID=398 RepID=A0ABR6QRT4_RHITR|nr:MULTISPECIES: hypothetical protein [Rhizobium]MBB4239878.1 hypothetical protein [Rhizobium tropici]MBB5591148.1 hypothetical protein [Rhizobium tropici]MBB6489643.1 hypothetical protein [Rhizobium tropici]